MKLKFTKKHLIILSVEIIIFIAYAFLYINEVKRDEISYHKHCITTIGRTTTSMEDMMEDELDRIPDKLLDEFYENDCEFAICSNFLYGSESWSVGYTKFSEDGECLGIYIREQEYGASARTVVPHEFGHYFDYVRGNLSDSEEWIAITDAEWRFSQSADVLGPDGIPYYSRPEEFFAEQFMYAMYSDSLFYEEECNRCPLAQEYIENQLKNYLM